MAHQPKQYATQYELNGKTMAGTVEADSLKDAERKITHKGESVLGEIVHVIEMESN